MIDYLASAPATGTDICVQARHEESGRVLSRVEVFSTWLGSDQAADAFLTTLRTQQARLQADMAPGFRALLPVRRRAPPAVPFRLEFPCFSADTEAKPFECMLIASPELDRRPDWRAFAPHLQAGNEAIVCFQNLGRDAWLVVPRPLRGDEAFAHLSPFLALASPVQAKQLLQVATERLLNRDRSAPIWLNTAGAGVPWLHLRLDRAPKYYRHAPYRSASR